MGLRDSALTIVFFNLLSCAPVAYMSTFGKVRRVAPLQHGLRLVVQHFILLWLWAALDCHLLRARSPNTVSMRGMKSCELTTP